MPSYSMDVSQKSNHYILDGGKQIIVNDNHVTEELLEEIPAVLNNLFSQSLEDMKNINKNKWTKMTQLSGVWICKISHSIGRW